MTDSTTGDAEGELALGASHRVGRYRHDLAADVWWWSDETYRIHGFDPGEVVPSTSLILAHKHPDDRHGVGRALQEARATGEPFSSVHRIMDARGEERTLAVVGEGRVDESGAVCEMVGYFADVTPAVTRIADVRATASIRASAVHRATIEQAKGVVMCALRTDLQGAFGWLREASNHANVPLRDVAAQIVRLAAGGNGDMREIAAALADLVLPPAVGPRHAG